ncbi:TIGR03086 family metal-binding protein [Ornithinimicrobium cavernae]|uniref:TIGR03086 family metal-binding protein n=1 Tax=Ornithinimicrobium cavernae TaxID=2666047 RepID=UPI00137A54E2|nr:TIGR03086 family metal-binding protein [Ornithinimicrobium cavernae]
MITTTDLLSLHAESIHTATTYVSWIKEEDLPRATPCRGWDLATLLGHMVGQNRGFALAVRDGTAPRTAYRSERFTHGRWLDSAYGLLQAFAQADPHATILEVELHPTKQLPLSQVIGAQLLDTAVHTWDVARTLDLSYVPTREIADAVLRVAETVPDNASRRRFGAAFAPALPEPPASSAWERALTMLGRDPQS